MKSSLPDHVGNLRIVTVPDPAAGDDWFQIVPINAFWRLLSVRFRLVTSAAVATRSTSVEILEPAPLLIRHDNTGTTQAASQIRDYLFHHLSSLTGIFGTTIVSNYGLEIYLGPLYIISSLTALLQPGDQLSNIRLQVFEWLSP